MRTRIPALLTIAFIISFSACKKNNDAPTVTPMVNLAVINASTDTFNFYLNGKRKNTTSTIPPGFPTVYYLVPKGEQSYQIKKPFNIATNTIQTLFSVTIPADTNQFHTLFVTDETTADAFVTVDKLQSDTVNNTCFIRFVNSSAGSGGLDLSLIHI